MLSSRRWLSPSPVNNSTWVALVDAEMASLLNSPDAFKLYDVAVKLVISFNEYILYVYRNVGSR